MSLPAATAIGAVRLRVADLGRTAGFYRSVVGLAEVERSGDVVGLGSEGGPALVELACAPGAPARPARSSGLFHLALLVPTRADLGVALRRVAGAGWRLEGASDHLVSEALYLRDPEGNGIEIYRDRPRAEWGRRGEEIEMATLPLDLEGVLAAGDGLPTETGLPAGTHIGHVHLEVSAIAPVEEFYAGTLGFDVTARSYPGALFVSAGGYHHHVGLNTWQSAGAPPPPPGALGLERFELMLPSTADRDALARRAGARDGLIDDPSGNTLLLTAAA